MAQLQVEFKNISIVYIGVYILAVKLIMSIMRALKKHNLPPHLLRGNASSSERPNFPFSMTLDERQQQKMSCAPTCVFRPITLPPHLAGSHTICQPLVESASSPKGRCDQGAVETFTVPETDHKGHAAITSSSNFEQNVSLSETPGFVKRTYSGATKCSQQPAKVVFHGRGSHKTCSRAAKAAAIRINFMFSRLAARWITRNRTKKPYLPTPVSNCIM